MSTQLGFHATIKDEPFLALCTYDDGYPYDPSYTEEDLKWSQKGGNCIIGELLKFLDQPVDCIIDYAAEEFPQFDSFRDWEIINKYHKEEMYKISVYLKERVVNVFGFSYAENEYKLLQQETF
jgi:hypothetical protein